MTTNRYVHVTYCDDIRQEMNGKLMFIGCYGSDLIVDRQDSEEVILPKLCAHVVIVTPKDRPFDGFKLKVFNSDEQIAEAEAPLPPPDLGKEDDSTLMMAAMNLTFVPFVVGKDGGKLRVEVDFGDEVLRAPGLRLRYRDSASRPLAAA